MVRARIRRSVLFLAISAGLLAVSLALLPGGTVDAAAHDWVVALTDSEVLAKIDGASLAELPIEYRKALFARLQTPDQRVAFWRGVFNRYRDSHTLTPMQSAALTEAEALLTMAMFTSKQKPTADLLGALTKVREALGENAERELFRYAGPSTSVSSGLSGRARLQYVWRSRFRPLLAALTSPVASDVAAQPGACQCAVGAYSGIDEDCWELYHNGSVKLYDCHFDSTNCPESLWTTSGCGPWWMSPCDGRCYHGPNSPPVEEI